ncbi:MAG TPA: RDD family protein [Methanothrix soehngenii]|nr:RDD family protein [Methanothrix soehngenii]
MRGGKEVDETVYENAEPAEPADEILLSSWGDRFWAWLIDVLLIGILWYRVTIAADMQALDTEGILLLCVILFVYWTAMEGYRGQSLGKMVLNISVTGTFGEDIRFIDAAIESFGKAFLLPIDCLACRLFFPEKRQRLFNRLSDTVVIKQMDRV